MFAHEFLAYPDRYLPGGGEQAELWRWHAVEEIEHKGVAFDTWLHATRGWSRWKRWRFKSVLMLITTRDFLRNRWRDAVELLEQDGLTGWRVKVRLLWFLFGQPGILRRTFPAWCAYFLPGFHPWKLDDRALIGSYDANQAAAPIPAA
jgi:predicted metal-dependent hydrolase